VLNHNQDLFQFLSRCLREQVDVRMRADIEL
jgi:hypothetical protein